MQNVCSTQQSKVGGSEAIQVDRAGEHRTGDGANPAATNARVLVPARTLADARLPLSRVSPPPMPTAAPTFRARVDPCPVTWGNRLFAVSVAGCAADAMPVHLPLWPSRRT